MNTYTKTIEDRIYTLHLRENGWTATVDKSFIFDAELAFRYFPELEKRRDLELSLEKTRATNFLKGDYN